MPESPFQSWARRLMVGPMPLLQQEMEARTKRASDEYAAEQQGIRDERTAGRQRENILLNIQEQARVQREKEDREKADAATRLKGLTEALKPKGIPYAPEFMGPPKMEEVLPHLTEKGRESMLEKRFAPERPDVFKGVPPEHDIVSGKTGEIVRPGKPKAEKPWYENRQLTELLGEKQELMGIAQPTPEQAKRLKQINALITEYQSVQGGIAYQRTREGEEGRRSLPVKDRSDWIHPDTLRSPPMGTSEERAIAGGYVQLDVKDKEKLAVLDSARDAISVLKSLADPVITAQTPMAAQVAAAKYGAAVNVPFLGATVPAAKLYHDEVNAYLGNLARTVGAERGVLTNQDIQRIRAAFPWFGDTAEIKDAKFMVLGLLMQGARDAAIRRRAFGLEPSEEYNQSKAALLKTLERWNTGSGQPKSSSTGQAIPGGVKP